MKKEEFRLNAVIDRFRGKRIAVWGDFILDEYLIGTTRRISREAPVLIISYTKKEPTPGGAGNSLLNLKSLGAEPIPIGVIGRDEAGDQILDILRGCRISTRFLIRDESYSTPIKTRILAGEENTRKQQILRIDKEGRVPETTSLKRQIQSALGRAKDSCSALLISDYHYMTVQEDIFGAVLPLYRKARIPVTLDSRFRFLSFKRVTVATPNEPEAEAAYHQEIGGRDEAVEEAGKSLLRKLGSSALLITRGSRGMALFEKGKPPIFIPIRGSADIVDVTGAGDTVISVFTLCLAAGASFRDAANLANAAGGIVVMKKGTATVSPGELRKAVDSSP